MLARPEIAGRDGGEFVRPECADVDRDRALARDAGDRLEVVLDGDEAARRAPDRAYLPIELGLAAARVRHGNHPGAHVVRGLRDAVDEVVVRIDAHDVAGANADPYEVRGV